MLTYPSFSGIIPVGPAFVYAYFLVPETKGLTLEQVDLMFEETIPRTSSKWKPTTRHIFLQ